MIVYKVAVFAHPRSSSGVLRVFSEGRNVNPQGLVEAAHWGGSLPHCVKWGRRLRTGRRTGGRTRSESHAAQQLPTILPSPCASPLTAGNPARISHTFTRAAVRGGWHMRAARTFLTDVKSLFPPAHSSWSSTVPQCRVGGTWVNFMVWHSYRLAQSACCCCGNPMPAPWGAHLRWTLRGKSGKLFTQTLEASFHS